MQVPCVSIEVRDLILNSLDYFRMGMSHMSDIVARIQVRDSLFIDQSRSTSLKEELEIGNQYGINTFLPS